MAVAVLLAAAAVVFSENGCFTGSSLAESLVTWALVCARIELATEILSLDIFAPVYLPTKYALLASLALFVVGLLVATGTFRTAGVRPTKERDA